MKTLILASLLIMVGCSSSQVAGPNVAAKESVKANRAPASVDMKRLLEIDERQGCCSHHGGVSGCSGTTLYCNDGTASGCGC